MHVIAGRESGRMPTRHREYVRYVVIRPPDIVAAEEDGMLTVARTLVFFFVSMPYLDSTAAFTFSLFGLYHGNAERADPLAAVVRSQADDDEHQEEDENYGGVVVRHCSECGVEMYGMMF